MKSEILNPDDPLTREDARLFERLARDKSWLGNIDADTRSKIVSKLLAGYARLKIDEGMSQVEIRLNLSILDRVARTFGLLDKVDADREAAMLHERAASTINNTQIVNITATHNALQSEDGRAALANLRDAMLGADAAGTGTDGRQS